MRKVLFLWMIIGVIITCTGCGETVRGMSKDAHRVGKGVKTIFVADE